MLGGLAEVSCVQNFEEITFCRAVRRRRIAAHQSRLRVSKMIGALDEIDHVSGRMDRQRMLGKAGPWRDVACHFTS